MHRPVGTVSWLMRCQNKQYWRVGDLLESPAALMTFMRSKPDVWCPSYSLVFVLCSHDSNVCSNDFFGCFLSSSPIYSNLRLTTIPLTMMNTTVLSMVQILI